MQAQDVAHILVIIYGKSFSETWNILSRIWKEKINNDGKPRNFYKTSHLNDEQVKILVKTFYFKINKKEKSYDKEKSPKYKR